MATFRLSNIRTSAATCFTSGNRRNLGRFASSFSTLISTTIKYVLNHVSEAIQRPCGIQKAGAHGWSVTVIPQSERGIKRLNLPNSQAAKILDGRFDTGCGAVVIPTIRQKDEEGAVHCPFMHALGCPNGLWFLDDLPCGGHFATVTDSLRLRSEMTLGDWDAVYETKRPHHQRQHRRCVPTGAD
jgi:hypothetical protein